MQIKHPHKCMLHGKVKPKVIIEISGTYKIMQLTSTAIIDDAD